MVRDKSLFYYGSVYHRLIDSITQVQRAKIIELIPENAFVLDVGCGTGELALSLHKEKQCHVVGIDLSKRMIDFASDRNPFNDVSFLHADATNISDFGESHFDYAYTCMVLHELTAAIRIEVIGELKRVASQVILLDYNYPLPRNGPGFISRLIEATLGRDHHANFRNYLDTGGLETILTAEEVGNRTVSRTVINNGCHQIVLLGPESIEPTIGKL